MFIQITDDVIFVFLTVRDGGPPCSAGGDTWLPMEFWIEYKILIITY